MSEYDGQDRRTPNPEKWHLKKEVNISIMAAVIGQFVIFGAMYGKLENRVSNVESQQARMDSIPVAIARIEEKLTAVLERLDRERR